MSTAYKFFMFICLFLMAFLLIYLGLKDGINKLLLLIVSLISMIMLSLFIHTLRTWMVIKKEQVGNIIFTRVSIISMVWFICIFAILGGGHS